MARAPVSDDRQTGLLSGIIGHELNNIAGALQGFTEIALNSARGNEPVREYLGEMRIAIGRIHALAHDLESLGEFESIRTQVPLGDCLQSSWNIDWRCGPGTRVEVDALHARRALEALALIGKGEGAPVSDLICVTDDLPASARCATCGAPIARHGKWVEVRVRSNPRVIHRETLRDPFGAAQTGRMIKRLTLAALVHSAHCAGGHVLIDDDAGLLGLVFALGKPG
jgi:signal transduction histidine kinase